MIKLRMRKTANPPELMISPMIDMIFLLLVFFILSTMYMSDIKTMPVKLPAASHSSREIKATLAVTMKADGSVWLEDRQTDINSLVMQASIESKNNPQFSMIIRADGAVNYRHVITLLDKLKGSGVTRFGLATDGSDEQ